MKPGKKITEKEYPVPNEVPADIPEHKPQEEPAPV